MAEKILELGKGLEIWKINVDEAIEQDVNAQTMTKPMFERLAETMKRDQRLESMPLCAKTERGIEIISGHHRFRAARSAGVFEIYVLMDVTGLNRDEIRAKQLAHNSLAGTSNVELVARIFREISDVNARLEAFVDETLLNKPVRVSIPDISLEIDYRITVLAFLPRDKDRFERAVLKCINALPPNADVLLAEKEMAEKFQEVMRRTGKEYDVRAAGGILGKMIDIVLGFFGEDHSTAPDEWIPLRDIVGTAYIPKEAAEIIGQALDKMQKAGTIKPKNRWQAFEYWAADHLAGSEPLENGGKNG